MIRARQAAIDRTISDAPTSVRKVLREAFSGSASPRKAVKAMCLACTGFERQEITNCTGYSCPLWMYRPFRDGEDTED